MKNLKIRLLIIDPQNDFCKENGALSVAGADDDMIRLAKFIDANGGHLESINVTLDSHRIIDIAHPAFWINQNMQHPEPMTIISSADIAAGIWAPRHENARPYELEGRTIGKYALEYAQKLEASGQYALIIWPPHCLIGSWGHNVHEVLHTSLVAWENKSFATVDYTTKGTNIYTEHYGGLMAEVPMPRDPATALNTQLLDVLADADIVLVAGEASSHCVLTTVNQIADNIGEEHIKKFHLLTDCMSPVGAIEGVVDFPQIAADWQKAMEKRGMTLTTSTTFFA